MTYARLFMRFYFILVALLEEMTTLDYNYTCDLVIFQ